MAYGDSMKVLPQVADGLRGVSLVVQTMNVDGSRTRCEILCRQFPQRGHSARNSLIKLNGSLREVLAEQLHFDAMETEPTATVSIHG
ncbi:hypothetical protein ACCS70_29335 [Rhizobium ruizarguesonis]